MSKSGHPAAAAEFHTNPERAAWHDKSLWHVRSKRDKMADDIPEWETLRAHASAIKAHTISHMDEYLTAFEEHATKNGITVHWAKDGKEHNAIVAGILQKHDVKRLVKSKSMLTEECHLNPHLESLGMEVIDTDLGERIVQLRNEPPSHIVMPAIHLKKGEIGELFHEHLGTEAGNEDPQYLTEAARQHLREKFLQADAGITGVNFAIAETGGVVVCTNEGNCDLGTSLPKVHIACMGMEKLIPRLQDLGTFTRLLARPATGQPITTYTSHFHGPKDGGEMHVVILDNGRSALLGEKRYRRSLHCIRCGACMNTCPVYRRSGGHSYGTTVPGPIGSTLSPHQDIEKNSTLPYACSLCASCTDVCPVMIDLHTQLYHWREEIVEAGHLPKGKQRAMKMAGKILSNPKKLKRMSGFAKWMERTPRFMLYNRFNDWGKNREMPKLSDQSFRSQWKKHIPQKPRPTDSEETS